MDTTDPEIVFDDNGVCSHCHYFDNEVKPRWKPDERGAEALSRQIAVMREYGRKREYDCILGLSGGVDSSYMALKVKEFGLRPLVIHVDAGWNSESAVSNIKNIVDHCGWDLHTVVMDWPEIRELQLAYLRSGVANQDVPQDHVFFASLYKYAVKNSIKTVLSGGNLATEAIFPRSWHYTAMDGKNIRAINRKHGSGSIKKLPIISFWQYYFYYPLAKGLKTFRPLNFLPYNRDEAIEELKKIGFKEYGSKHCESIFTKFFQRYYLPHRFGYDKRRPHLSSQILSGQITREEALVELSEPLYSERELENDKLYLRKKLGLSQDEFEKLLEAPKRKAEDYPSDEKFYKFVKSTQARVEKKLGLRIRRYS